MQQFSLSFQQVREMTSPVTPAKQGFVFSCTKDPLIGKGLYFTVIDFHGAPIFLRWRIFFIWQWTPGTANELLAGAEKEQVLFLLLSSFICLYSRNNLIFQLFWRVWSSCVMWDVGQWPPGLSCGELPFSQELNGEKHQALVFAGGVGEGWGIPCRIKEWIELLCPRLSSSRGWLLDWSFSMSRHQHQGKDPWTSGENKM